MLTGAPPPPRVLIVTPTYNHSAYVAACVESALAQTIADWRMVVVDDGSTDGTADIMARYDDPRITLIRAQHRGLDALGELYADALRAEPAAPFVAILEGDDAWPPDKLERQLGDFEDPDVVLSHGAAELIDGEGCVYAVAGARRADRVLENRPVGSAVPALAATNFIVAVTCVVRRAALDEVGGFVQPPGVPYVDHATWLRLAQLGEFRYHATPVGRWRRHAAQYTTTAVQAELPDLSYAREAATERAGLRDRTAGAAVDARAGQRQMLNRFRLALLDAPPRDVARQAVALLRTGRPRLVASALLGLVSWVAGGDLEWLVRRQRKVSWPSRRHVRGHRPRRPSAG